VDERCEKVFLPAPHPPPSKSTLSPRKRVILDDGFCDFAFGFAQNDSVSIGMSESFLIRETKLKGV